MGEQVETFTHNGREVTIYYDTDPMSPRDADNLGIMLANGHKNYTLGDEKFLKGKHSEYDDAERALSYYAERGKIRLFARWCSMHLGSTVVLALGLIDHSGISMYVIGDNLIPDPNASLRTAHPMDPGGWDSGLVGFVFDTKDTRETCGVPVDKVEEGLRSEVEVYDQYLTGDVYGYVVEADDDGNDEDSCWGFFGLEYAIQSARDAAGYTCKNCEQGIQRWVGRVVDEGPNDFVHSCCDRCLRDVQWGGDGWFHNTVKPWDWPDGKPDHKAELTHRHACSNGETFAETDQEMKEFA